MRPGEAGERGMIYGTTLCKASFAFQRVRVPPGPG